MTKRHDYVFVPQREDGKKKNWFFNRGWAATIPGFGLDINISHVPRWYHVWYPGTMTLETDKEALLHIRIINRGREETSPAYAQGIPDKTPGFPLGRIT